MLTSFRSFAKSPPALVIVGLLILGFAFYGVGGIFTGSGTAVAAVGNETVSVNELRTAYNREIQLIQRDDPSFTQDMAREYGLGDQVLQRLIVTSAFSSKANELGLAISDETLFTAASRIEAFRSPVTGRYDYNTMVEVLGQNGYTEATFEAELGGDLLRSQLTTALGTGIDAPPDFASVRHAVQNERRVIRGLFIEASTADAVDAPTDDDLQAFIDENPNATDPATGLPVFMAPEMRALTLVRFQVADFAMDVEVDEAELRATYDYQVERNEIGTPARRSFTQVNAPDETTARAIVARIASGEEPATIAAELGLVAPLEQDDVESYEVPDADLSIAVFAAPVGEALAVEGTFGWYAVHVTGGVDADTPSFEEQLPILREAAARDEALNVMYDKMGTFTSAMEGGARLEEAAAEAGVPVEVFPALDIFGRDASLAVDPAMIQRNATLGQEILPFAFDQFEGIPSDLEQFNEGDYFSVRVDSIQPEAVRALEDVRDVAEAGWRAQQVDVQLEARAAEAFDQIQAGEDIDLVALTSGGRVEMATLMRTETAGLFTRNVVSQAFGQPVGEFAQLTSHAGGVHGIIIVDEIIPAAAPAASDLATLQDEVDSAVSSDILLLAQNALLAEYGLNEGGVDPRLRALALGETDPNSQ